jgi:hypothetical protein
MQNVRCHVKVVLDQVAFRQPQLRKEHLVQVGELDSRFPIRTPANIAIRRVGFEN